MNNFDPTNSLPQTAIEAGIAEMSKQDITFANCDSSWQKRVISAVLSKVAPHLVKAQTAGLDWHDLSDLSTASSNIAKYCIIHVTNGKGDYHWSLEINGKFATKKLTRADAKAFAEVDFHARLALSNQNTDQDAITENELQEIADGAWGNGPKTRGTARDRILDQNRSPILKAPPSSENVDLNDAARKAQKAIATILENGGLDSDKWWNDLVSAQQSLAQAIQQEAKQLSSNTINQASDELISPETSNRNQTIHYFTRNAVDDEHTVDGRKQKHFDILAEAMAEVKATSDGLSVQSIADIVEGCINEIDMLYDTVPSSKDGVHGE
jgi:hypothetical protein